MRLLLVIVLMLFCCARTWAQAPATPPVNQENATTAAPPMELVVRPKQIHISQMLMFDANGASQQKQSSCSMTFAVQTLDSRPVLGYRIPLVSRILLNTNRILELKQQPSRPRGMRRLEGEGEQAHSFTLHTAIPPIDAASISRLEGTITFIESDGPPVTATLPVMREADGRKVQIEGLSDPEAWVTVRRTAIGDARMSMLGVEMQPATWEQCLSVKVVSADGAETSARFTSYSSNGTWVRQSTSVQAPDDSRVVLTFASKVKTVEVPFLVQNIALPRDSDMGQSAEIRVQAQEDKVTGGTEPSSQLKVTVE